MFNAITRLYGESTSNGRNRRLFHNPLNPAIGSSEETPPGQGCKRNSLFNDVYATTMYPKRKKGRSELQRRHDVLLHKSRHNPNAYYTGSLEDMAKTVEQYRETARVAEADAERGKKVLVGTQNQVGPSVA